MSPFSLPPPTPHPTLMKALGSALCVFLSSEVLILRIFA